MFLKHFQYVTFVSLCSRIIQFLTEIKFVVLEMYVINISHAFAIFGSKEVVVSNSPIVPNKIFSRVLEAKERNLCERFGT